MIGKTKVNKDEFLQKVADNSDIDIKIVNDVYDNIIDTIKENFDPLFLLCGC